MLDHYWKGRGCLHLMEWMCRTLHTPNTFPACLMEHLVNSGRGDLVTQLIEHMTCLQLSQGLQSNQQTMQVVYHAKQSMCASHKTSLSMFSSLGSPQSIHSHKVHINNLQEVVQSAAWHASRCYIHPMAQLFNVWRQWCLQKNHEQYLGVCIFLCWYIMSNGN